MTACANQTFEVTDLAKSEVDLIADAYVETQENLLKSLLVKLYKRNPRELNKTSGQTINKRAEELFGPDAGIAFEGLHGKSGIDAMLLAFDEQYLGDRVFALMAGMVGMLRLSWNGQREFFLPDALDEQKLYNGARNIEIVSWRLRNRTKADGQSFLIAQGSGADINLSIVRIFAKLTAHQDMMARLVAQRNDRMINRAVHAIATTAFLPI
ncbi:hypothetical protein M3P05_13220 [Sansalvadorimonas sp. 2012CJ34-2]|uniref:Lipoprotein n=1 Tax=Parendozoicomonas callyspongiae TaxID=2942213 RepID=A0ABT0PHP6_9GAMM|nr:hypothetical protein [Sansalvadorimonas sp. 2012CJ34-2]MCL6270884.1 hypothetical protein [Sansalvadorimonas sp. 2012CJ34-2]